MLVNYWNLHYPGVKKKIFKNNNLQYPQRFCGIKREKSAARLLKHFANSSIDAALWCQHTSFTPTAFHFNAFHFLNHTVLLRSSGTHTYSRLHIQSSIHTHRVSMPRRRWAAGTVTLRMRNRNMRGPIKTGQGNIVTCVHPKVQTATLLPLAVLMTNVRTDRRTDTHKKINRREDYNYNTLNSP